MLQTPEENLLKTGLTLPPPPKPAGVYKPLLQVDNLIYVSGHGPVLEEGILIKGKVGFDINAEAAKLAAKQTGLTILATLKSGLGSLNKIKRVIKVFGMVNCTLNFEQHPFVINGCSELFAEIWGSENGVGVRSAVGMGSLPDNIPVEIEAVFELADDEDEISITESVTEIEIERNA
jgi:enamine deaminase RidA (YjgF/YER057c/UK114 family)